MTDKLPRILIVDDEDAHLAILQKILEEADYGVETCSSGLEVLSRLRANRYDAVLCDIWMPGITGLGLYQLVKEEFPQYNRRFIFITADVASEMTWAVIRDKNLPCVKKPFTPAELLEKVNEVLRIGEVSADLRQSETDKRHMAEERRARNERRAMERRQSIKAYVNRERRRFEDRRYRLDRRTVSASASQ